MSATIAKNLLAVSKTLTAAAAALAAAAADLQKSPAPAPAAPAWSEEQKKKLTKFKEAFMTLEDMDENEARAAAIKKLNEKPAGNSGSAVDADIDQPKKRGRPAGSGKKNVDDAVPSPAPAAKPKGKMALRMITKEDVRNASYTLGEFTKHLREDHGLLPDSEQYLSLKKKFLDTRQKLKAEVEKEMAEEQDVSDDEALVGEYTLDGDEPEGDDEPEEIVAAPAPRSRAKAPVDDWEQGF